MILKKETKNPNLNRYFILLYKNVSYWFERILEAAP